MSATDKVLYNGVSWATNAIPSSAAGDPGGRPPSTVTPPADGAVRPTARFSSVVLPAPFGPTSAATCPAGTVSVHSRSAQVRPYRLPRPLVSMTFILGDCWFMAASVPAGGHGRITHRREDGYLVGGIRRGWRGGSVQVCWTGRDAGCGGYRAD